MPDLPDKAEFRRLVRERMRAVPAEQLAAWSAQLVDHLESLNDLWQLPGTVALFGGLRNEPDLITGFIPWLRARGWRTVLFTVEGVTLQPYDVTGLHHLKRGPLGVWEPLGDDAARVDVSELSLILVPGLAFSRHNGVRLGRGGGFYDRLLACPAVTARRVGVCFEAQFFEELPQEDHDLTVRQIVTEEGLIQVRI